MADNGCMEQTNAADVRLTVRLDEQTMAAIRSQAQQERRTVAAMARILIEKGLRERGYERPADDRPDLLGRVKAEMLDSMHKDADTQRESYRKALDEEVLAEPPAPLEVQVRQETPSLAEREAKMHKARAALSDAETKAGAKKPAGFTRPFTTTNPKQSPPVEF